MKNTEVKKNLIELPPLNRKVIITTLIIFLFPGLIYLLLSYFQIQIDSPLEGVGGYLFLYYFRPYFLLVPTILSLVSALIISRKSIDVVSRQYIFIIALYLIYFVLPWQLIDYLVEHYKTGNCSMFQCEGVPDFVNNMDYYFLLPVPFGLPISLIVGTYWYYKNRKKKSRGHFRELEPY